jgi:hypothetical protein
VERYISQGVAQRVDKFRFGWVIAIVGGLHPDVVPDALLSIEIGTVLRQRDQVETTLLLSQPTVDLRRLVIRCVVLYQINLFPWIGTRQSGEKSDVTRPAEHGFAQDEMSARLANIHRSEHFLRVALAGRRNHGLMPDPRPSLVEGRILAKAGLVCKQ